MRILFDQGTPVPIRRHLEGPEVRTVAQQGWGRLKNGELLAAAAAADFEIFLTTDKNIRYQQNLSQRKIGNRGSRRTTMAEATFQCSAGVGSNQRSASRKLQRG